MTATACCTSKPIIYQIQVITTRSKFASIVPRTSLSSSSSSSTIAISELRSPIRINKTIESDVNNNDHPNTDALDQEILDIINDDNRMGNLNEERFLALVGLRHRAKKKLVPASTARPLAKRLAAPICLLPLPKFSQRVRKALYILLPFLKFLSITHDIELFCSTDEKTKTESLLLSRSVTQTRSTKLTSPRTNKRKVSKSEFITMAANTFRNNTRRTPMAKYVHSTIQCQVVLDRLDQLTINQMMENSTADNQKTIALMFENQRSLRHRASPMNNQCLLNQTTTKTTTTRTTITTMTTQKTTVKHKSSTSFRDSKRFKASLNNDCLTSNEQEKLPIAYKRIYLKCFVCSKREYIDPQATNSDILHSHWLEHGRDLLLNIYDSEVDSILTRIVEFFHFPRRHRLEGKIQNVFILNSKEIRRRSAKAVDDESCIVLD